MWINLNQSLSSSFDGGGVGGVYRKCSWPDGLMALDEKFDPRSSRAMPVWWESNTFAEVTSQTHDHNLCHDINTWMSSYCCGILAWVKKPKRLTFLTSTSTTYSKIQNGFSAIHHSVVVVFCRSFGCLCLITAVRLQGLFFLTSKWVWLCTNVALIFLPFIFFISLLRAFISDFDFIISPLPTSISLSSDNVLAARPKFCSR